MEQMKLNQEGLRDELEIEIAYEEDRRKELEQRHAQFIKQLDFMTATRIVNLKNNLDQPEKPSAIPGGDSECRRCKDLNLQEQQMMAGADPNSQHIYATVRKSGTGSPTRFKGKRESVPNPRNVLSQFDMRPANH